MNKFKKLLIKGLLALLLLATVFFTNGEVFLSEDIQIQQKINQHLDNNFTTYSPVYTAYASYLNKYQGNNVVTVGQGGNVDFNTIQGAINSITDAAADNWYRIEIGPGTYTENVVLGNYMSLMGMGSARDVIIRSTSGITLTFPSAFGTIDKVFLQSAPIASGAKVIDAPNGGTHSIFLCGIQIESSTNGIIGQLIDTGGTGVITIIESVALYTLTGSSAGSNTHIPIEMQGSMQLRLLRTDVLATIGDIDDDVNLLLDNSSAALEIAQSNWGITITNASYSGNAIGWNHTKDTSSKLDSYSLMKLTGAGAGTGTAIKVDSDTNNMTLDSTFNKIEVSGFTNNYHTDIAIGDVLDSRYDFVTAADGTIGAGDVNFTGSFATGQALISGGGVFTIDTINEWHAFCTLTADTNTDENATVTIGTTGAITVFADAGGGQVTVTSAGHSLAEDDYITIAGTTSYNGVFQATNVGVNDFEITDTWVANDATGTFHRGTSITVEQRGIYQLAWSFSATSAGNNKVFDFVAFNGITEITGTELQRKFGTAGDVGVMASAPLILVEKDDVIWFAFRNTTDATNITVSEGSLNISKES